MDTQGIRRQCDGGCGRTLARYTLCASCEDRMRAGHEARVSKPTATHCGDCGRRVMFDPRSMRAIHSFVEALA